MAVTHEVLLAGDGLITNIALVLSAATVLTGSVATVIGSAVKVIEDVARALRAVRAVAEAWGELWRRPVRHGPSLHARVRAARARHDPGRDRHQRG